MFASVLFSFNHAEIVVQRSLFRRSAVTVYNGIPLKNLDAFKASNSRAEVRRALGYKADDFLFCI